jgi:hypothetical protein
LESIGYEAFECASEEEARDKTEILIKEMKWPCLFSCSDTTGEKGFEEFYTVNEVLDLDRFESLGIIKNEFISNETLIEQFRLGIDKLKNNRTWSKAEIVSLFKDALPGFDHVEIGKSLDSKM